MSFQKIAAIGLFLLAVLLAVIAGSVLRSGAGGYIGLIGWPAMAGALLALLFAVRLWRQGPPVRGRGRQHFSAGQRLGLIAIGVFALGMGAYELATGKADPVRGAEVRRAQQPGKYWTEVLLHLGGGVLLLYLGLRRPPDGREDEDED